MRHHGISPHPHPHSNAHSHAVTLAHARRSSRTSTTASTATTAAFQFVIDRFLLLPIGVGIAIVWANTFAESYFRMSHALSFVVNEVGMAFFLALISQEVLEAVMPGGALHSWRRWGMPLVAAAGGLAGAALVYLAYVHVAYELMLSQAWPIACAIDVAAAYFVMKTIAPRSGALPFVLLLAIATDVVGLAIVAPRYESYFAPDSRPTGTVLFLIAIGIAALMRASRVRAFWPYLAIGGTVSWWAFYWVGLHPALALVPIVPFLPHEPRSVDLFADPPDDDATHRFEHEWNTLVQGILFCFGLVNGGVVFSAYGTGTWAVLTAAFVGRPAGILIAVGLAVAAGLHLPRRIGWRELIVIALATSSGFVFALFFATGVMPIGPLLAEIKIGALATAAGALLTVAAAWLLKVGKFAPPRHARPHVSSEVS